MWLTLPRAKAVGVGLAAPALVGGFTIWLRRWAARQTLSTVAQVTDQEAAIVPGCRVTLEGRPGAMLEDRLAAALALWRAGKVERLLVSGAGSASWGDEVAPMAAWLSEQGVPERVVLTDSAGVRTRATMDRAAQVFQIRSAVVCTQAFHLPRALWLARRAGIAAQGLAVDRRAYQAPWWSHLRELAAISLEITERYL